MKKLICEKRENLIGKLIVSPDGASSDKIYPVPLDRKVCTKAKEYWVPLRLIIDALEGHNICGALFFIR